MYHTLAKRFAGLQIGDNDASAKYVSSADGTLAAAAVEAAVAAAPVAAPAAAPAASGTVVSTVSLSASAESSSSSLSDPEPSDPTLYLAWLERDQIRAMALAERHAAGGSYVASSASSSSSSNSSSLPPNDPKIANATGDAKHVQTKSSDPPWVVDMPKAAAVADATILRQAASAAGAAFSAAGAAVSAAGAAVSAVLPRGRRTRGTAATKTDAKTLDELYKQCNEDLKRHQREVEGLKTQLEKEKADRDQALKASESQLKTAKWDLEQAKTDSAKVLADLDDKRAELDATKRALDQSARAVTAAKVETDRTKVAMQERIDILKDNTKRDHKAYTTAVYEGLARAVKEIVPDDSGSLAVSTIEYYLDYVDDPGSDKKKAAHAALVTLETALVDSSNEELLMEHSANSLDKWREEEHDELRKSLGLKEQSIATNPGNSETDDLDVVMSSHEEEDSVLPHLPAAALKSDTSRLHVNAKTVLTTGRVSSGTTVQPPSRSSNSSTFSVSGSMPLLPKLPDLDTMPRLSVPLPAPIVHRAPVASQLLLSLPVQAPPPAPRSVPVPLAVAPDVAAAAAKVVVSRLNAQAAPVAAAAAPSSPPVTLPVTGPTDTTAPVPASAVARVTPIDTRRPVAATLILPLSSAPDQEFATPPTTPKAGEVDMVPASLVIAKGTGPLTFEGAGSAKKMYGEALASAAPMVKIPSQQEVEDLYRSVQYTKLHHESDTDNDEDDDDLDFSSDEDVPPPSPPPTEKAQKRGRPRSNSLVAMSVKSGAAHERAGSLTRKRRHPSPQSKRRIRGRTTDAKKKTDPSMVLARRDPGAQKITRETLKELQGRVFYDLTNLWHIRRYIYRFGVIWEIETLRRSDEVVIATTSYAISRPEKFPRKEFRIRATRTSYEAEDLLQMYASRCAVFASTVITGRVYITVHDGGDGKGYKDDGHVMNYKLEMGKQQSFVRAEDIIVPPNSDQEQFRIEDYDEALTRKFARHLEAGRVTSNEPGIAKHLENMDNLYGKGGLGYALKQRMDGLQRQQRSREAAQARVAKMERDFKSSDTAARKQMFDDLKQVARSESERRAVAKADAARAEMEYERRQAAPAAAAAGDKAPPVAAAAAAAKTSSVSVPGGPALADNAIDQIKQRFKIADSLTFLPLGRPLLYDTAALERRSAVLKLDPKDITEAFKIVWLDPTEPSFQAFALFTAGMQVDSSKFVDSRLPVDTFRAAFKGIWLLYHPDQYSRAGITDTHPVAKALLDGIKDMTAYSEGLSGPVQMGGLSMPRTGRAAAIPMGTLSRRTLPRVSRSVLLKSSNRR